VTSGALSAVVELRARLFWRRLAARSGLGEGVSRVVLLALAIPAGLAVAVGLGFGTYQAAKAAGGLRTQVAVAAILFGLWQTWTATSLSLDDREGLDLRRFLVYPVPAGRVYALGLVSGLVGDPVTTFWGVALSGVLAGAALARPGAWLLLLGLALALFAAATMAFIALLQEVLAVAMESRRAREWGGILSVVLALAFLGLLAAVVGRPIQNVAQALPALRLVQWVAWPAALAAPAMQALLTGRSVASLPWMAALAAATAATGWLAFRIALRQAMSGGGGGSGASSRWDARLAPPVAGARGALLEKELKYLARHPLARMDAVLLPAITALVAWKLVPRWTAGSGSGGIAHALPLLGLVAYTHLLVQPFWLNAFGWDRGGARLAFLAPVGLAEVLRAKNLAVLLFSACLGILSAGVLVALSGAVPAWEALAAVVLFTAMAPWLYAAGNLVSILQPRASPFAMRGGNLSALSALAGIVVASGVTGVFTLPALAAQRWGNAWIAVGSWAVLGAAGWAVHRATLPVLARLLAGRRDALLPVVCGDDA
jgi:ABC-2 type transport system permease protein